jgi:hypothetical protein
MSEIAAFHNTTAITSPDQLTAALAQNRTRQPQATRGGKAILKLEQNDGFWHFGQDNEEVEDGTVWAINPYSLQAGWVAWGRRNNRSYKAGEVMDSFANPPACPTEDLSADGGATWAEQVAFELICVAGSQVGQEVIYNSSSKGGKKGYDDVYDALQSRPNSDYCFPVILLEQDSYNTSLHNKRVFNPIFRVIDWANGDQELLSGKDLEGVVAAGADVTPAPAAKVQRRRRQAN